MSLPLSLFLSTRLLPLITYLPSTLYLTFTSPPALLECAIPSIKMRATPPTKPKPEPEKKNKTKQNENRVENQLVHRREDALH